jgi:cyclophilin family peptidyl-prolyl cis-trans isomerase
LPESKRRRRRRGPAQQEAQRKSRLPFPINLIFNAKAFYVVFILAMIAGMASVGFINQTSGQIDPPPIIDQTVSPEATAQATVFESPAAVNDPSKDYVATIKTNKGDIVIELDKGAKESVNSFHFLASKNFYDGQAFFYVDDTYVAQAGDPACKEGLDQTCTGSGDASYRLDIEESSLNHVRGAVVAPAIQGTESVSGGQFRILLADDSRLDGTETVFGEVTSGLDIFEGDFFLCSALTQEVEGCAEDFANAVIIEDVLVEPVS